MTTKKKRRAVRSEKLQHAVESVEVSGKVVRVVCSCGWRSADCKDETRARSLHTNHAGR